MKTLRIEMPDTLAEEIKNTDNKYICQLIDLGIRQLKMENALVLLKKGGVSIGYVAGVAGVSEDEMATFAYVRGFAPTFSQQTLREELGIQGK
ncbi:MAG: hypothetical protein QME42_06855 [bacterium]|nr:hypothetical protein [bacterium]